MKKVEPLIFLIILLLFPMMGSGQKDFQNGYLITNNNDTLFGMVKDRKLPPFGKLYKKVRFKHNTIFTKKYGPNQVKGYKQGSNQYESMWIEVSRDLFREKYTSKLNYGEKHFLKVIVKGYLTYYQWEFEDPESDFIDYISLYKKSDEPDLVRVTQGILGLKKKHLRLFFQDCPELVDKIDNGILKNPRKIAAFYNHWKETQR